MNKPRSYEASRSHPTTWLEGFLGFTKGLLREYVFIDTTPGKLREYQDRLRNPYGPQTSEVQLAGVMELMRGWSARRAQRMGGDTEFPRISSVLKSGRTAGAQAWESYHIQSSARYGKPHPQVATRYDYDQIGESPFLQGGQIDDIRLSRDSSVGADGHLDENKRSDVLKIGVTSRGQSGIRINNFTLEAVGDGQLEVKEEYLNPGGFTQEPKWETRTGAEAAANLELAVTALRSIEGLTLGVPLPH